MSSYKNKHNKGVALILALGVSSVLLTLSMAYVGGAIQESSLSQRYQDSMASLYEAERGIAYAFVEAQNAGFAWVTHGVDTNDANRNGDTREFTTVAAPAVTLGGTAQISSSGGITINPSGNYQIPLEGSSLIQVRSYANPNNSDELFLLAQATVGTAAKTIKMKVTRRPLFRYFYYYPGWKYFSGQEFNGKGRGGIYVKWGITLANSTFNNMTELATGPRGIIVSAADQYETPYEIDFKMAGWGNYDGKSPLPSSYDSNGNLVRSSSYNGNNPWQSFRWPPGRTPPLAWMAPFAHFSEPGKVNGVNLPTRQESIDDNWPEWEWVKYMRSDDPSVAEQTRITNEMPVKFCNPCGERDITGDGIRDTVYATAAYWESLSELASVCGPGQRNNECGKLDPDFWSDKTYNRSAARETDTVRFLNTGKQAEAWKQWTDTTNIPFAQGQYNEGHPLSSVVKEGNTGGYDIAMPKIDQNYAALAREEGLYIGDDGVYFNGALSSLPTCIRDEVEFFNTLRPQDRDGDGTMDPENVMEIDVGQCVNSEEMPANGIVYVAHKNIRLTNAKQMPVGGLTVVSPYNIYIKGNYNFDPSKTDAENDNNWRPSSVISNSYVYILSDAFNDPQSLPDYVYPREYPYEVEKVGSNINYNDVTQRANLATQVRNYFGLANFDMTGVANKDQLRDKIRVQYNSECQNTMPNVASPTKVRSAVASVKDMSGVGWDENSFYQLERWTGTTLRLEGAFIQLGESWAKDAEGEDISDIPQYLNTSADDRNTYWGVRRGSGAGVQSIQTREQPIHLRALGAKFSYEILFNQNTMPPGNLSGASESSWQEVSDFTHA